MTGAPGGSMASKCGGYHYRIIAVGYHGQELSVLTKMHATDEKLFKIPLKIDSFCCLKLYLDFL